MAKISSELRDAARARLAATGSRRLASSAPTESDAHFLYGLFATF
jgi:hypothetical protein